MDEREPVDDAADECDGRRNESAGCENECHKEYIFGHKSSVAGDWGRVQAVVLMPHLHSLWGGYLRLGLIDDLCELAREKRNLRNSWASPCGSGPAA